MQITRPIYHILFWVFVFFFVFDYVEPEHELLSAIILTILEISLYALFFYVNLYFLIPKLLKPRKQVLYFLGLLLFLGVVYVPYYFSGLEAQLFGEIDKLRNFLSFSLNYVLFILISFLYWYLTLYQRERQNRLALQNEKLQAELSLLKSQVSPHFLFNSLNNLYKLSLAKDDQAPVMIEKLSDILRYLIYEGQSTFVPLENEVELLQNYLDLQLMKKPKGANNVHFSSSGVKGSYKIAPLMLISLVENCFKHSDIGYNENGFLEINMNVEKGLMHFSTSNSYRHETNDKGGIGLENLKRQLGHHYPDTHYLMIRDEDNIFKVNLQIRLEL